MAALNKVPMRQLGKHGPLVSGMGLGLMSASGIYNAPLSDAEHLAFLDAAYEKGARFWDTADEYGSSEDSIGKWFAANPDKRKDIFLGTKFAVRSDTSSDGKVSLRVDSSPEYCREAIEVSLKRLGLSYVDLYYVHRLDKVTPIEKTMEAMVSLKNEGKIKYIGLSECSATSLRRAHAVHPITCVQVEYSLFCRDIESPQTDLLKTARELGVAIVCYSPLGNGFLSNTIRTREDVSGPDDRRGPLPWLSEENLPKNLTLLDKLADIAKAKGVTTAQLALAWLLAQGEDVIPIPGTTKVHRLVENLETLSISLSSEEERSIRQATQNVAGGRVQSFMGYTFADTPAL